MRDIYQNATLVFSWLGHENSGEISRATSALHRIGKNVKGINWQTFITMNWARGFSDADWEAISRLFQLPYWDRVWIFQELVLAKRLLLSCPTGMLQFDKVVTGCLQIKHVQNFRKSFTFPKPPFLSNWAWTVLTTQSFIPLARVKVGCEWLPSLKAAPQNDDPLTKMRRFTVMNWAKWMKATNPKDYIYGLLGVSGLPITPDYTDRTSVRDVYVQFVKLWLKTRTQVGPVPDPAEGTVLPELFFLSRSGTGIFPQQWDVPSWAPRFAGSDTTISSTSGWEDFGADKGLDDACKHPSTITQDGTLLAYGISIGELTSISTAPSSESWRNGTLLDFVSSFLAKHGGSYAPNPVTRPRTRLATIYELTARCPKHPQPPQVLLRSMLAMFETLRRFLGMERSRFYARLALLPDPEGSYLASFLAATGIARDEEGGGAAGLSRETLDALLSGSAAEDTLLDRTSAIMLHLAKYATSWRFAETGKNGYVGAVPRGAAAGDVICVLKGCGAPVVLRPAGDGFSHVGTCLVVGLMDGEAAGLIKSGTSELREFSLG